MVRGIFATEVVKQVLKPHCSLISRVVMTVEVPPLLSKAFHLGLRVILCLELIEEVMGDVGTLRERRERERERERDGERKIDRKGEMGKKVREESKGEMRKRDRERDAER